MAFSNTDIAQAVYSLSRDKTSHEQKDLSLKVVKFLSRRRLLSKSSQILSELSKIINKEEGRVIAKVSSVEPADHKTQLHIRHALEKHYKAKQVVLEEAIDKSLLGGIKIEVESEMIDLSIKNRIGKLQEHLTHSI